MHITLHVYRPVKLSFHSEICYRHIIQDPQNFSGMYKNVCNLNICHGFDILWMCVHAQSLSRVWLLCSPMDCSSPGSSVHEIFQARTLEWVAISFYRGSSQPRDGTRVSCVSYIGRQILYHWATWEAPYIYNWKREINKYTMSMKHHIIQTSPTIQFGVQNFCVIWK